MNYLKLSQKYFVRLFLCRVYIARNNLIKLKMIIKKILRTFNGSKSDLGSLTTVGVGPGDPSLLTIAAVDAIKKAKVIVFPISDDNKKSFAAKIVKKYLSSFLWLGGILILMKYGLVL